MEDLGECYRILDLKPGASLVEIKFARRELVKVWHPDRFEHDPALQQRTQEKLKQINLAYERLCKVAADEATRLRSVAPAQKPQKEQTAQERPRPKQDSLRLNLYSPQDQKAIEASCLDVPFQGARIAVAAGVEEQRALGLSALLFDAIRKIVADKSKSAWFKEQVAYIQTQISPIGLEHLLVFFDKEIDKLTAYRHKFQFRVLEITARHFSWDGQIILAEQIGALRCGITLTPPSKCVDSIFSVCATSGVVVSTDWLDEEGFSKAVGSMMNLHAARIINGLLVALDSNGCYIGNLHLSKPGISFETGVIFTKKRSIAWADTDTEVSGGNVQVYSRSNPRTRITVSCRTIWNACLLPPLVELMKSARK